jgi:uncharacterized protein
MAAPPITANGDPLLANLLLFPRALQTAGVAVSLDQTLAFLRALAVLGLHDRDPVYHAGRALLVTRQADLAVYDAVFAQFFRSPGSPPPWGRAEGPSLPPQPERKKPVNVASYMAVKARFLEEAVEEVEVVDRSGTWSAQEQLTAKDFAAMTPEELAAVRRLIQALHFVPFHRKTRRQVADPRGRTLDLRRALRSAARAGGVPLTLPRKSPKSKQRPVVLIADVSGSMEKYSRLVLQLFYSMSHALGRVESFVFGTRLTRITPQLALRNIDQAIDQAAREILDWGGGTRIGESLRTFNRRFARRVLGRGAVVLILSDGWERGDSALLGREMRYLNHRCHRLIWLNPLLGGQGYEPKTAGMVAALPFVDDFLSVHNVDSLEALGRHLGNL